MLGWLGMTLGIAFGSAILPLISIEIFVVGLVTQQPDISCFAIGAAVAIGQVAGKLFYFLWARGDLRLPEFLHRKAKQAMTAPTDTTGQAEPTGPEPTEARTWWRRATTRIRAVVGDLVERCRRHPHWMLGTYGVSSLVGLPPFMAMSILAGAVRMRLAAFLSVGLVGRFVRFSALAASPALISGYL